MDVELLLQGVIRFSNFMTSRLLVSGVVFYVLAGFVPLGNATEGFLPSVDILNGVVQNYQNIFDTLGVSDFAILLILFIFLTTIHLVYVAFESLGHYLPPAIVPLSGWTAIDDITLREDVTAEILDFSRIWVNEAHQRQIASDCVPTKQLKPATWAVVVPVFGTLDALMKDLRSWRSRRTG